MKKLGLFIFLLFASIFSSNSQIVIDYMALTGTNVCNIFAPPIPIQGKVHSTTLGQVTYDQQNYSVVLEATPFDYSNSTASKATEFSIANSFEAGHSYKITVHCVSNSQTEPPTLKIEMTNTNVAVSACSGPQIDPAPNSTPQGTNVYGGNYTNFDFTFNALPQAMSYIRFKAVASIGTTSKKISIDKISITDLTLPPGTFSMSSSTTSRTCTDVNPITFTLNHLTNPNSVVVTSYRIFPQPGQWVESNSYYDIPANGPNNSGTITLHPLAAASNLSVSARANVGPVSYAINAVTVANTLPSGITAINGPSTITCYGAGTNSAQYSIAILGFPNTSYITPTWTITPYYSYYSGETVGYNANGPLYATVTTPYSSSNVIIAPWSGAQGLLNVNLQMCGLSTDVSKVVTMRSVSMLNPQPKQGSQAGSDNGSLSLLFSPNPTSENAHLTFGKNIENGFIEIINSLGESVKKESIVQLSEMNLDLSTIKPGSYFIKLNDGERNTTEKFVKN